MTQYRGLCSGTGRLVLCGPAFDMRAHRGAVSRHLRLSGCILCLGLFSTVPLARVAGAAAPPNDICSAATVIPALPFTNTVDTADATTVAQDPLQSCVPDAPSQN